MFGSVVGAERCRGSAEEGVEEFISGLSGY